MYMYVCMYTCIHTHMYTGLHHKPLYTYILHCTTTAEHIYVPVCIYIYTHTQHAYSVIPKAPRGYFASGARGELSAAVRRDALPAAKEDSLVLSREWGN